MRHTTGSRWDTSPRLNRAAWSYLRGEPRLLAILGLGSLLLTLAAAAIYLPFVVLGPGWDPRVTLALATLVMVVPLVLITRATNAVFLATAGVTAGAGGAEDPPVAFVSGLATIPGFLLVAAGAIAIDDGSHLGGPIAMLAGIALLAPVIVCSSALTELHRARA